MADDVVVRAASAEEVDLLTDLRLRFLAEFRGVAACSFADGFVEATRTFLARGLADGSLRSWVAEIGGAAVGVVSVAISDLPPKPEDLRTGQGHVLNLWIDEAHRQQGIGRRLLLAVEDDARATGARALVLHTTDDGQHLYDTTGFEPDDRWRERILPPA